MPRIPKWLLLKEWLSHHDVVKLLENSSSCLEYALAQDCSEEIRNNFKFVCTFAPDKCQVECKEYRFEEIARHKMRAHLKEHINLLKSEENIDFKTRNQLFKGNKSGAQKNKSPFLTNKEVPIKKVKSSKKASVPVIKNKTKGPKAFKPRYTKLKVLNKKQTPSASIEDSSLKKNIQFDGPVSFCDHYKSDFKTSVINISDIKFKEENLYEVTEDIDTKNCETQTPHVGKEQETFQYKVATKLFAVDRSHWNTVEKVLEDIISSESPSEILTQEDKDKILDGMRQWMDSVQIYDHQTVSRLQDPLTPAEKTVLEGLTTEDWRKLEASHDSESKLRLTVYARMLLRDYECFPRKLKPKFCRHCGKNYTASTSLYSHLVSLSGIRFWICCKCKDSNMEDATFTRKHSLQYHILKEVGIPRYRCTQPGCNKTHNHTHHQKSHARQHTGEKHYICIIEGCKGRFSNRNTYSRHLLQFHSVELTRNNELQEIDEKEARLKVYAARLKARERSKCKRQQGNDNVKLPFKSEVIPRKVTIDENILTAAQHFLTEVKQEEDKKKDANESETQLNLEKFMRPSASKLLYGIAKDVRNTTSCIEEAKPDNNMGGLNLLATVSKYMNTETCPRNDLEHLHKQENTSSLNTFKTVEQKLVHKSIIEDIKENNLNVSSRFFKCIVSKKVTFPKVNNFEEEKERKYLKDSSGVKISHTVNSMQDENVAEISYANNENEEAHGLCLVKNISKKDLPLSSSLSLNKVVASHKLHCIPPSLFQRGATNSSSEIQGNYPLMSDQHTITQTSYSQSENQDEIIEAPTKVNFNASYFSDNVGGCVVSKSDSDLPANSKTCLSLKNLSDSKIIADINDTLYLNTSTQRQELRILGSLSETPTSTATSFHKQFMVEKTQDKPSNEESMKNMGKRPHIINVSNSDVPLQFKSMTTLSGKTYIVLSSSGKQYKLTQPTLSGTSCVNSETLTSSRVLPFSEL
ncbi:hypothetical protein Btru_006774 [Bulinus truncatus]|nr:hypothetical protein Btru_006774 [Bulinus truncatus]